MLNLFLNQENELHAHFQVNNRVTCGLGDVMGEQLVADADHADEQTAPQLNILLSILDINKMR